MERNEKERRKDQKRELIGDQVGSNRSDGKEIKNAKEKGKVETTEETGRKKRR